MCKYCEAGESLDFNMVLAYLKGNRLALDYDAYSCDSSFEDFLEIKYCPMCGRELEKENHHEQE